MSTVSDVMEHHSEDDDDIESGSTSSLNSDTDSNDLLVTEMKILVLTLMTLVPEVGKRTLHQIFPI